MTRFYFFVFMYGLVALTGIFLSLFWPRIVVRRWKELWDCSLREKLCDRVLGLSATFSAIAIGSTSIYAARTLVNLKLGLSPHLRTPEAYFIAFGLICLLIGMAVMVWMIDLDYRSGGHKSSKTMIGITILWFLFCVAYFVVTHHGR